MRVRSLVLVVVLAVGLLLPFKVSALNQNPNLNIGLTNMLDGIIPPPGVHLLNYFVYYDADDLETKTPFKQMDHELEVKAYAPQLIYIPDHTLPGGLRYGFSAILPLQDIDVDSPALTANSNIIGDLAVGPFIGKTVPLARDTAFHWFLELDTYLPVGDYDNEKAINPSANYVSFNPFLSMSLTLPQGFAVSTRQFYTYNFENDDYRHPGTGAVGELQAGQMYHFNYSVSKNLPFIHPYFRIGAVGYYLNQLTADEFDGQAMKTSHEKVFAIGPGIVYIHKGIFFGAKAMFETETEERFKGTKYVFQVRFKF